MRQPQKKSSLTDRVTCVVVEYDHGAKLARECFERRPENGHFGGIGVSRVPFIACASRRNGEADT